MSHVVYNRFRNDSISRGNIANYGNTLWGELITEGKQLWHILCVQAIGYDGAGVPLNNLYYPMIKKSSQSEHSHKFTTIENGMTS